MTTKPPCKGVVVLLAVFVMFTVEIARVGTGRRAGTQALGGVFYVADLLCLRFRR